MNLLFVCTKNNWRSRTAEIIFGNLTGHQVKSAGIDADAKVPVTSDLLKWADLIFVMEEKNKAVLAYRFKDVDTSGKINVLDIPDRYQYMDEELILVLKTALAPFLDAQSG